MDLARTESAKLLTVLTLPHETHLQGTHLFRKKGTHAARARTHRWHRISVGFALRAMISEGCFRDPFLEGQESLRHMKETGPSGS